MLTLAMPWTIITHWGLHNACRQIFQLTRNNKIHWLSIAGHLSAIQTVVFPYCNYQLRMKPGSPNTVRISDGTDKHGSKTSSRYTNILRVGRNEMGSVDGIWFPLIHWRATSSGTLQVKITVSPGQAACLPACCTLEVRVTWAIECWKYSCICMRQKITPMSTALTTTT